MLTEIDTSFIAGVMFAGIGFRLFRPVQAAFGRWRQARELRRRVLREDALKHIHRCQRHGLSPSLESLAGALGISVDQAAELLNTLEKHRLLKINGVHLKLTAAGQAYALHILRAHRLWEHYLAETTGYDEAAWHEQAEWAEHQLTPEAAEALATALGHPTHDPHGDPIPTADGELINHGGRPITDFQPDVPLQIVHLEDEPEAIYAQLIAEGLHPGQVAYLLERTPQRVRIWADNDEHLLAPIVAANIEAVPLPAPERVDRPQASLSDLRPGQQGEVTTISRASRGMERRRFMDLGILPGTIITAEMTSPGGDPTAYRIRGALIALRREQAGKILITVSDSKEREA